MQPLHRWLPLCHCWLGCIRPRGATTLLLWGNSANSDLYSCLFPHSNKWRTEHSLIFLTNELKSDANRLIYYIQPLLGVSEQWIGDSKPPLSTGRLLAPHYWPSHRQAEWHQVLQVWQDNPVPQPRPVPLQEYPGCSLSPATNYTCVPGGKSQHFWHVTFCITFILETYMVKCPWWNFEIDYRYSILRK